MLRFCTVVLACLTLCLGFARADSDATITIRHGVVTAIVVDNAPPDFNDARDLSKFTVDGKKVTEEQLVALVFRGDQFRICDIADYVALFTVWKDADGNNYYKHPDGVYRVEKPKFYTCPVTDGDCTCVDCTCAGCPRNKQTADKPASFADIYGNVYTLGPDGVYQQSRAAPQGGCPNGRCPNR